MLMPPSIGYLNRVKTKYIKICKGTEMKYVKMTNTLTALYEGLNGVVAFTVIG